MREMNEVELLCPDCGAKYELADNYCRQCGMYLAAQRSVATVVPDSRAVEPVRTALPAPVKKAATAVAVGAALQIAVGVTGRYLARQAAKQAVAAIKPSPKPAPRRRTPENTATKPVVVEDPAEAVTAVSETLVIQRVWMRRR